MKTSEAKSIPISRNITRESGFVTPAQRAASMRQKPVTLWMTGLSGSGKSSIARALEQRLVLAGQAAFVLDGDNVRHGLNRDLGFSSEDRGENIRRVAEVCGLFNDAGVIAIASLISPYSRDRRMAREIVGEARFIEIFIDTPLELCERRDAKGLYRKARAGEIPLFTGVSATYEAPEAPDLRIATADRAIAQSAETIVAELQRRGIIPMA